MQRKLAQLSKNRTYKTFQKDCIESLSSTQLSGGGFLPKGQWFQFSALKVGLIHVKPTTPMCL